MKLGHEVHLIKTSRKHLFYWGDFENKSNAQFMREFTNNGITLESDIYDISSSKMIVKSN